MKNRKVFYQQHLSAILTDKISDRFYYGYHKDWVPLQYGESKGGDAFAYRNMGNSVKALLLMIISIVEGALCFVYYNAEFRISVFPIALMVLMSVACAFVLPGISARHYQEGKVKDFEKEVASEGNLIKIVFIALILIPAAVYFHLF